MVFKSYLCNRTQFVKIDEIESSMETITCRVPSVTGNFTDFPVCVIPNTFIRKLSHLTIPSPFILINQKMHKNHSGF